MSLKCDSQMLSAGSACDTGCGSACSSGSGTGTGSSTSYGIGCGSACDTGSGSWSTSCTCGTYLEFGFSVLVSCDTDILYLVVTIPLNY
jgi:hypothetical protein